MSMLCPFGRIPITNMDFNSYIFPSHTNFPVRKSLVVNESLLSQVSDLNRAGKLKTSPNGDFFEYEVDIGGFRPDEVDVMVDRDEVLIDAKHEDLLEHETIHHELKRRFKIPKNIRKESIYCQINSVGHLQITGSQTNNDSDRLGSWIRFRRESFSPEKNHEENLDFEEEGEKKEFAFFAS